MDWFRELVVKSRTVRRYEENNRISTDMLKHLVELCRYTASAGNRQPSRFIIVNSKDKCDKIFSCLKWLGYLAEDLGPAEGERPSAYIILLYDKRIPHASIQYDAGIVSQTIVLGANYHGLGCCIIGSVDRAKLRTIIPIGDHLEISTVISLGIPVEKVIIENSSDYVDVKYWRDENKVHHVPKMPLDTILVGEHCE